MKRAPPDTVDGRRDVGAGGVAERGIVLQRVGVGPWRSARPTRRRGRALGDAVHTAVSKVSWCRIEE